MEKTAFDLNQARADWRRDLASSMAIPPESLDELESHLLDSMAASRVRGLTGEEAFHVAVGRVGPRKVLASEFAKVNPAGVWRLRAGWMLAGVLFYLLATDLASVTSGAVLLLGSAWSGQGMAIGWAGLVGQTAVLAGMAWAFARLAGGRWNPSLDFGRRWLARPVALGLGLLLLIGGLRVASTTFTLMLVRQLPASGIGQVFSVLRWGGLVGSLLLVVGLSAGLALLVRSLSRRQGAWVAVLVAGCLGGDWAAVPAAAQTATEKAVPSAKSKSGPTLDQAIALWKSGQKEESLDAFLNVDFARRPLFPAGSILGYSEQQFMELPSSARDKVQAQLIAEMPPLKQIAAGLRDRGQTALKQGRKAESEKCFSALARCGEAFESKDSLALLQVMGRAYRKLADPAAAPAGTRR
jgi:hypothetical protein